MATGNMGGNEGMRGLTPAPADANRGGSAPTLKDQAGDLGRKASQGARNLATQAQSEAESRLERGRHDAASTLTSVATTLLQSGSRLRDEDQPVAGDYVERAARQIERAANYVQNADVRQMMHEVEDFARRRPAVFIGGAFAAGLLAARFLKSSRSSQLQDDLEATPSYMDREVPSPVAMEPRPSAPQPVPGTTPWQEPPL